MVARTEEGESEAEFCCRPLEMFEGILLLNIYS